MKRFIRTSLFLSLALVANVILASSFEAVNSLKSNSNMEEVLASRSPRVITSQKGGKEYKKLPFCAYPKIRIPKGTAARERYERVKKRMSSRWGCYVLDGGKYRKTAHVEGYQIHHLISQKFCRDHKISIYQVPCVTIPREIHMKTGSHPASHRSREYFIGEEEAFKKSGGSLTAVAEYGLDDLERVLDDLERVFRESNPSQVSQEQPRNLKDITPVKCARAVLTRISPTAQRTMSPETQRYAPTPTRSMVRLNRLIFLNFN